MSDVLKPSTDPYAELCALPEHLTGEILNGVLHAQPRPAGPHAFTASGLLMDVGGPFQRGRGGPGGWWIIDEPELHLGGDVLVPDLAGWRRQRLPSWPQSAALELAPDWICEVVSPSTRRLDRILKLPIYARESVGHVWIIDPKPQTLEVFRRTDGHWLLVATHAGNERIRAEPFDAVELDLQGWWGEG